MEDPGGFYIYLTEESTARLWSIGKRPIARIGDRYEATRLPGGFSIVRQEHGIEAQLEICVDPDRPAEVRRVRLANHEAQVRRIELTTYAEIVLQDLKAHRSHPAFSKLFVRTEYDAGEATILAHRRPRGSDERHPWAYHAAFGSRCPGASTQSFETDRARFIGRGRHLGSPAALEPSCSLSGTEGDVLDPIFSLRRRLDLEPGGSGTVTFVLGAAANRHDAIQSVRSLRSADGAESAFARSAAAERARWVRSGLDREAAAKLEDLAAGILCGDPSLRAAPEILLRASGGLRDLATLGVVPGRELIVLHAENDSGRGRIEEAIRAHRYFLELGLEIDLIVVCRDGDPSIGPTRGSATNGPLFLSRASLTTEQADRLDAAARCVLTPGSFDRWGDRHVALLPPEA